MSKLKERVERGARLLDEHFPGWWKRINLDTLRMNRCTQCVVGQLTNVGPRVEDAASHDYPLSSELFVIECDNLRQLAVEYRGKRKDFAGDYGFDCSRDGDYGYDDLDCEWKAQIAQRRTAQLLSAPGPETATAFAGP